jgi:hypothetical protein
MSNEIDGEDLKTSRLSLTYETLILHWDALLKMRSTTLERSSPAS